LWLLDADVIIDLLSMDVFDKLTSSHEIFAASTVINEVRFFKRSAEKHAVDLREQYLSGDLLKELSASTDEIKEVLTKLPVTSHESIDAGELESLAILAREEDLIFCSCDAAGIRALPFLDLSDRGISVENLLKSSGLQRSDLKDRHTEQYFRNNLAVGQESKIYLFKPGKGK
jgi:predicted nucleic acid-binding protein